MEAKEIDYGVLAGIKPLLDEGQPSLEALLDALTATEPSER
jgi:hypothetical protein